MLLGIHLQKWWTLPRKDLKLEANMAVFSGCQITLELDSSVNFKKKTELKKRVIDNGGIISFIVTKKV